MNWKFWQKQSEETGPAGAAPVKLSGPKAMPDPVGRYLVVHLKKDPDWVWKLECVVRPRAEGKNVNDIRVFDANQVYAKNVHVKNYLSLDGHPDLILYEGWYDKKTMKVEIAPKGETKLRAA